METLLVFGFTNGEEQIVLAAPSLEIARELVFEQTDSNLFPLNYCLIEWKTDVMEWNEGATLH